MTHVSTPARIAQVDRRTFLQTALTGSAAIGTALSGIPNSANATSYFANSAALKLSLAAYSFNRFLPRNWPKPRPSNPTMTMEDFVDYCGELNLDGCELTSYYFPNPLTEDYLSQLKKRAKQHCLQISGTAIGNDFCMPEGDERKFQLDMTRKWIDYSAFLGASVIRIFAGRIPKGDTTQVAIDRCIAGINESVEYAAEKGVALALENHGGITATPEEMLKIIKGVTPSRYFGVNFDSGNFHSENPYRDLEKIAPYAINAQLKVMMIHDGKKKPVDLAKMVQILKDVDYRHWIVLEYEESEPKKDIPKYIERLRELI